MTTFERVRVWDTKPGAVVRRAGHPLRIGIVLAARGEDLLVRWSAQHAISQATWHHYSTLERRTDAPEIGLAPIAAAG